MACLLATAAALSSGRAVAQPAAPPDPTFDDRGRPAEQPEEPPAARRVTPPELKRYAPAAYPEAAEREGVEGEVILRLTVEVDGTVSRAEVAGGGGHGFDQAALDAAPGLLFEPARDGSGNPFRAVIKFRYRFELSEPADTPAAVTPGRLQGKVVVRGLELPLSGATIEVVAPDGSRSTLRSDAAGVFELSPSTPGTYRLSLSSPGYEPLSIRETIAAGEQLEVRYALSATTMDAIEDVVVTGERPPREVTRRTVEKREIDRIPGTGGDALRSIQSLPGVARTPGPAAALLVRGSAPFDTQTFVDGVYVPIIYHFGGLSSVVPTELLSKIDFYPGNYSARYGRALGGIVDAGIRSPRSDGYHGLAQLDLVDARLMLEGPVPNVDGWTFAVAGRRSWLDAWLGPVLEAAGAGVTTAPRYYDYQMLLERKWKDASLRLSFYGSDDALEILVREPNPGEPALSGNLGFGTSFQRWQIGYQLRPSPQDEIETQIALGHEAINVGLGSLYFDVDAISLFARTEYRRTLARQVRLNTGLDLVYASVGFAARLPAPQRPGSPPNQPFSTRNVIAAEQRGNIFRPALHAELELTPLSRWRIVPGLRLDYSHDTEQIDLSPRFNTRFDLVEEFPRTTLKGGVGVFSQAPQPQQSIPPLGTEGLGSERAIQYGLGVEQEITRQIDVTVEGFLKQIDDVIAAQPSDSGIAVVYTNEGRNQVVGGELLLRYHPDERFFGWIAYTLSRAVRQSDASAEEVQLPWDQTHNLVALASYRFDDGWEVGARFRLVSGNLADPNVCNVADQRCDPNRINALFHAASGAYTPIRFGADNGERLPLFHQLDLRVDKGWTFPDWKLSAYLDVQNVYNNQNVEGITYDFRFSTRQFVTGIPILPSLGLRAEF